MANAKLTLLWHPGAMGRWTRIPDWLARSARAEVGANVAVLTALGVLIALVLAVLLSFRHAVGNVNALDRVAEQQLVANYLDRAGSASLAQQKVQITWDDAFRSAGTRLDPTWADNYIGDFLYDNFGYHRLFLVDPEGRLLRAWKQDSVYPGADYAAIAPQVRGELARIATNRSVFGRMQGTVRLEDTLWPVDREGHPLTRWSHLQVRFDGHPAELTIASILPDTDYSLLKRTPNHLVAIRFFDRAFLNEMGQSLLLEQMEARGSATARTDRNALPLVGSSGENLGWFEWKSVPRGSAVQARMRPIVIALICFLLALLFSGWAVARMLLATLAQLRAREAQAIHEAKHDAMTGLPNRASFAAQVEQALKQIAGTPDRVVVIALCDLDHFKVINDTLGHDAGDELIRQVARRCLPRLAEGDVLARLGGDEFALLRVAPVEADGIKRLGRELQGIFAAPFALGGRSIDITASFGISWAPHQAQTASDLLRKADMALYRAKQRGRARWRAFSPDMAEEVSHRLELETELRKALQQDSLDLAFQPIVRASDNSIEGAEALLRWHHPELGEISPTSFVEVAEQTGLMQLLGWWMLRRLFECCRAWPTLHISANLSPVQLSAPGFIEDLEVLVREYRVPTSRITFEVTEGVLMERRSSAFQALAALKELGFSVALDDFGTGYSSLGYLRMFQFDRIKIDRTFVQNIENDLNAQAILRTIIALGRDLKTRTVAEGVETRHQNQLVVDAGCDLIQGYYHWRPMSAEQLDALISRPVARIA